MFVAAVSDSIVAAYSDRGTPFGPICQVSFF